MFHQVDTRHAEVQWVLILICLDNIWPSSKKSSFRLCLICPSSETRRNRTKTATLSSCRPLYIYISWWYRPLKLPERDTHHNMTLKHCDSSRSVHVLSLCFKNQRDSLLILMQKKNRISFIFKFKRVRLCSFALWNEVHHTIVFQRRLG